MTPDEAFAWLGAVFPSLERSRIDARPYAISVLNGSPVAVTTGFSGVDTGLVMRDDQATEIRCEIVCRADAPPHVLGAAVVAATREIEALGVPAQPGVLLEGLLDRIELPGGATVRHGLLREPELFQQGTPIFNQPGRMTLLLELVALTDDEFSIASERGYPVLETRLRRRGARVTDWSRE